MAKLNWERANQRENVAKNGSVKCIPRKKKKSALHKPMVVSWPNSEKEYVFKNSIAVARKFGLTPSQVVGLAGCGKRSTKLGILVRWK